MFDPRFPVFGICFIWQACAYDDSIDAFIVVPFGFQLFV
jgi:hypothetical protein